MINILGINYKVEKVEDINNNENQLGEIDYHKNIIKIKKTVEKQTQDESLVHEIVHGILLGIGYHELNDDEQFVSALSRGIYQVFKDNEVIKS